MPLLPLVPLTAALVPTANAVGFDPGTGINRDTPPDPWSPDPTLVRTASFPTPLALAEATLMLLRREGTRHDLLTGAELLLQGLVAGVLELQWVPVDELRPSGLQAALRAYVGDRGARVGLIRRQEADRSDVWGSITLGGVPCLAGSKLQALRALIALLGQAEGLSPQVVALLDAVRQPLHSSGQWDRRVPWMALVDRVRDKLGAPGAVDLCDDVRSIGPLELPVPPTAGGVPEPRSLYLLAYDPGFVLRLARALTCVPRRPGDVNAQDPDHIELLQGSTVVARFCRVTGRPVPAPQLGEGLARDVTARFGSRPPSLQGLAQSVLLRDDFSAHLAALRRTLGGSMVEALTNAPCRLTDVARVAARHAPELVDDVSPQTYSPAFAAYQLRSGVDVRPSVADIERLCVAGRAFMLAPAAAATRRDLPVAVFLEDGTPEPERRRSAVGDLSGLGLAMWLAFTGAHYDEMLGFVSPRGEPLVETGLQGFPAGPSEALASWWGSGAPAEAALVLATLQRFLATYPPPPADTPEATGTAGLAACAVRCFAGRLLDDVGRVQTLQDPGAGQMATPERLRRIPLTDYGTLLVSTDPLR